MFSKLDQRNSGYHIVRVGMAITFLWVGLLIFQSPLFWAGFLHPALFNALPDPAMFMLIVGIVDILIGFLLLVDVLTFWVSLVAALHLLGILIVSGIDETTVRDIGLFAAAVALMVQDAPEKWRKKGKR